jgi:UDP-glucose 4-epimerase
MKDKKIVITGGLGFIGSHLVESLIEANDVTIIDDQSSGKLDYIKSLNKQNIELIKGNINDLNLNKILEDKDYLFHEAALVSVPESILNPLHFNEVNIKGTLQVLMAARDSNIKKMVFASSAAVYGNNKSLPLSEEATLNPLSPYAVNKVTGEMYCQVFTEAYGLPTVSLRYFNIFGPRQDPNSQYAAVIPNFINAILNNQRPIIYGDGEQSRDFIYVKHVAEANIKACESNVTGVFNVAFGKSTTINELVKIINEVIGKNIEPIYEESRPGDVKHSIADISEASLFGFNPQSDFKSELRKTVEWFNGLN